VKFGMVRALPDDDFMHAVDDDVHFNESGYFNFGDPGRGLGGFLRIGNRPNDGYAEVTNCLFLPDDRVAFFYQRAPIEHNKAHDAGGLRFETVTPHREHRVAYRGEVLVLERPEEMEEPRAAYRSNPQAPCTVDLTFRGVADTFWPWVVVDDGDGDRAGFNEGLHSMFARNHLNQHMAVTGTVTIGDDTHPVDAGLGWRDRSWGPRSWQQVPWYRWSSVSLGPDLGLALIVFGDESGTAHPRGYVHHGYGTEPRRIVDGRFDSDYDDRFYAGTVRLSVRTEDGEQLELEGTAGRTIPLRFRNREDRNLVTRLTEAMITWRHGDRTGVGILEYLAQMVDGRPIGTTLGV